MVKDADLRVLEDLGVAVGHKKLERTARNPYREIASIHRTQFDHARGQWGSRKSDGRFRWNSRTQIAQSITAYLQHSDFDHHFGLGLVKVGDQFLRQYQLVRRAP